MQYTANEPLNFAGTLNVRELGGYVNADGVQLKTHKVLRGDDLSNLTEEGMKALQEYGVKICIDLRIYEEKQKPDPFYMSNELEYHSIPIKGDMVMQCEPGEMLYRLYVNILENHAKALLAEMRIVAREEEGIIFHCTAGKDRTGVTAMLILAICGVSREQIVVDYEPSGKNIAEQIKRQKQQLEECGITSIPDEIFESRAETMDKLLDYLEEKYDGPVNYLRKIGLSDSEIEQIRKKMLED